MIFWSVFLTALIATAILTPAAIWLAPKSAEWIYQKTTDEFIQDLYQEWAA